MAWFGTARFWLFLLRFVLRKKLPCIWAHRSLLTILACFLFSCFFSLFILHFEIPMIVFMARESKKCSNSCFQCNGRTSEGTYLSFLLNECRGDIILGIFQAKLWYAATFLLGFILTSYLKLRKKQMITNYLYFVTKFKVRWLAVDVATLRATCH